MEEPDHVILIGYIAIYQQDLLRVRTLRLCLTQGVCPPREQDKGPPCFRQSDGRGLANTYSQATAMSTTRAKLFLGLPDEAPVMTATLSSADMMGRVVLSLAQSSSLLTGWLLGLTYTSFCTNRG